MKIRIGFWSGLFLSLWTSVSLADPTASALDQEIQSAIRSSQNVPNVGVSVGVVKDGKLVFAKGYGYRDRARRLPSTEKTMYVAGSMSKAFTVAALVMESEAGHVSLSKPVRGYAGDFKLSIPQATEDATLIDLLSHQSGLPRHDCFWYISDLARGELFARLGYLGPNLDPKQTFRKAYQYNNLIFMAAGTVLERVSGARWEDYLRDRVLKPLGMSATSLDVPSLQQSQEPALGYAGEDLLPYKDVESIAPAAAVNTNVLDMAKWLQFHLDHGVASSGKRLISLDGMETMYKPRIDTVPGTGAYYAMGWRLDKWAGKRWIRHAGNMDGFLGLAGFVPDARLGTIVLTNQNDSPVPTAVTQAVMKAFLGTQALSEPLDLFVEENGPRAAPARGNEPVVVADLSSLDGRYSNPAYGEMSVAGGEVSYGAHRWKMRATSDADVVGVTLDLGGRTQEFLLKFSRDSVGKTSGFSVSFDENSTPFRFAKL